MSSFQIAHLEALFRGEEQSSPSDFRAALDRLYSELLNREHRSLPESKDFFLGSLRALKRFKGTSHVEIRLRCLQICLRYFFYHGNSKICLAVASEHQALASLLGSPAALRLSHSLLGMVYADMGNIGEALNLYATAIELSRQLGDQSAECMVLNNLGTALNYAGLHQEAVLCFERILQYPPAALANNVHKSALSNLAQSYYYLENFHDALQAIRRCVDPPLESSNADANFRQTIREFVFVQVALEVGLVEEALAHSLRCGHHANASGSDRCKVMAEIATSLCSVRIGNTKKGLDGLERVLAESQSLDSSYRDALIAIVKAYDEAGQPDVALKYIDKLLAHVIQRKTAAVQTLLSTSGSVINISQPRADSLFQTLERRKAILRARVAERDAAESKIEMLERLAATSDLREDASGAHGFRVGKLSAVLALAIGWSTDAARSLEIAARLHDIGKIGIPDRILGSSKRLKDAERRVMCMHTEIGAQLLAKSKVPQLRIAEEIARHHHEWWDGSGYPDKLKAGQIPVHARIVALADVFDALTHGRPYADPWQCDRAIDEIRSRKGSQFDPRLTDRFLEVVAGLRNEYSDLDLYLSGSGTSPFLQARRRIRELLEDEPGPVFASEPVLESQNRAS